MSITNKLTYLEQTKEGIKQAIINKGVNVSDSDTFRSYASKIGDIQTGGGSGSDCNVSTCWDSLGYNDVPQYLDDAVAYGAQIKDTWDTVSLSKKFWSDKNLVFFPNVDTSKLSIQGGQLYSFFYDCINLQYVPNFSFNASTRDLSYTFFNCEVLKTVKIVSDFSNITNMSYMFNGCKKLYEIEGIEDWNTGNVTNMSYMFNECISLPSLNLNKWDLSKASYLNNMFYRCKINGDLIINNQTIKSGASLSNFIDGCTAQKIELKNWIFNATSLSSVFRGADTEYLDLSGWDSTKVLAMYQTFRYSSDLVHLNITGWDTSNVRDMQYVIESCTKLEKIDGFLDLTSCDYSTSNYFGIPSNLHKVVFKNIGYKSAKTAINFSNGSNWGVDTVDIPDAKQSLIDSLITYSFDRASAGYSTHTITLGTQTKAVLTESEIAQITAKGYTIA